MLMSVKDWVQTQKDTAAERKTKRAKLKAL